VVTTDPQIAAARYVVGVLTPEQETQVADELLAAGVYTPAAGELEYLRLQTHPGHPDVDRAFLSMLDELGVKLPTRDDAVWLLARFHISRIANREIEPGDGLRLLSDEVYMGASLYEQSKQYVGDSHGLQHLLGMYYSYDDLVEISGVEYKGLRDVDAIRSAMDEDVVAMAKDWLTATA
jgi:hypothetical protein